jgi:predicted ATP-dependent protease
VLAAHRNGLRTVILPKRNEQDLDDVPDEIKKTMKFIFVETVDEVLDSALETNHKRSTPHNSGSADKSAGSKQTSKKKSTSRKTKTNGKSKSTARRR